MSEEKDVKFEGKMSDLKEKLSNALVRVKPKSKLGVVDVVLEKIISRKLAVMILATYLLMHGFIDMILWVKLTGVYLGVQGLIDLVKSWNQP